MPQWLIVLSSVAIALGLGTAATIALDVTRHPQHMTIMNFVWPVTELYFPLVGWRLYTAMGRSTGVDAAAGLSFAGERLFAEYVVEFVLAYLFGIAFRYLPIRAMRGLGRREALLEAIKADTLSLIAFEVGMFAWMAVTYFVLFTPHRPGTSTSVFWLMMQIGMLLGFATTFPANWVLVKRGIKMGM